MDLITNKISSLLLLLLARTKDFKLFIEFNHLEIFDLLKKNKYSLFISTNNPFLI